MMNSFNCTGRLIEDPMFFTGDPDHCCFTLAVDRDGHDKDSKTANADYLDFVAWGDKAKNVRDRFRKGDLMQVANARAKVRTYEDSGGAKKRKTEFVIDKVYCLARSRENKN